MAQIVKMHSKDGIATVVAILNNAKAAIRFMQLNGFSKQEKLIDNLGEGRIIKTETIGDVYMTSRVA